jgi:hypothetical protein
MWMVSYHVWLSQETEVICGEFETAFFALYEEKKKMNLCMHIEKEAIYCRLFVTLPKEMDGFYSYGKRSKDMRDHKYCEIHLVLSFGGGPGLHYLLFCLDKLNFRVHLKPKKKGKESRENLQAIHFPHFLSKQVGGKIFLFYFLCLNIRKYFWFLILFFFFCYLDRCIYPLLYWGPKNYFIV